MSDTVKNKELKDSLLTACKEIKSSNSYIEKKRWEAIHTFEEFGFPGPKHEEWKYLNFKDALKKDYSFDHAILKNFSESSFAYPFKTHKIVFVNGALSQDLTDIKEIEKSIELGPFSPENAAQIEKYFARYSDFKKNPFEAVNTGASGDPIFIRIKKGKEITTPISIHYLSDSTSHDVFVQPRVYVWAEENSHCQIIETCTTFGKNFSFTNSVTELVLEKEAHVDLYKVQKDSENSYQVSTTTAIHDGRSDFSSTTVTVDGGIVRNNLNIVLNAQHSESFLYGLYLVNHTRQVDNHTLVDHAVPNCHSNELYKGILNDKGHGVFNGKILVKQDAQKTNAFQSNKNILLSKDASMNTKPQLEIFADDVKCSHGATIGQLDEEPMFYLRARGIKEETARMLLIKAFAKDVIDHIKIEPLKEYLDELIDQKFFQKG